MTWKWTQCDGLRYAALDGLLLEQWPREDLVVLWVNGYWTAACSRVDVNGVGRLLRVGEDLQRDHDRRAARWSR